MLSSGYVVCVTIAPSLQTKLPPIPPPHPPPHPPRNKKKTQLLSLFYSLCFPFNLSLCPKAARHRPHEVSPAASPPGASSFREAVLIKDYMGLWLAPVDPKDKQALAARSRGSLTAQGSWILAANSKSVRSTWGFQGCNQKNVCCQKTRKSSATRGSEVMQGFVHPQYGCGVKSMATKKWMALWKQGLKPLRFVGGLILSHSHMLGLLCLLVMVPNIFVWVMSSPGGCFVLHALL